MSASSPAARRRIVAYWVLGGCGLIFLMVVVGGITRLTHSGLSIVEWQPVVGTIPPLNDEQWEASFAKYRETPEFKQRNPDMTVEGYKKIFWWEYSHRLLGRIIGIAFLAPFLFFLWKKMIPEEMVRELWGAFALGALQGLLGWWMVQSGLVSDPRVSSLRLAAHLGLAFFIYGILFWAAMNLLFPLRVLASDEARRRAGLLVFVIFVMVLSGALVAAIRAGFAYNTFPTMNGQWVPDEIMMIDPWWMNFIHNMAGVQLVHRVLAIVVVVMVVLTWSRVKHEPPNPRARLWADLLVAAVILQVFLGITTLLLQVPINLAVLHQAGAVALFTCAIGVRHALRPVPQLHT